MPLVFQIIAVVSTFGGIGIAVTIAVVAWISRRQFMKALEQHECHICHNSFSDAIAEYMGTISRADANKLDSFQRRYATYKVRCLDCNSVNICTRDGQPFKAITHDE